MKIPNLFNNLFKKDNTRNLKLLEEYKKGRIIQVDNKIDNKKFLRKKL